MSRELIGGIVFGVIAAACSAPTPATDVEPAHRSDAPSAPVAPVAPVSHDAAIATRSACELAADDVASWFATLLRDHAAAQLPLPRAALDGTGSPVELHTPAWYIDSREVKTWGQRATRAKHWRLGRSAELAQVGAGDATVRARLLQRLEQEPTIVWPDISTPHVVLEQDVSAETLRGLIALLDPGDRGPNSKAATSLGFVFRGARVAAPPLDAPKPRGRAGLSELERLLVPCTPARSLLEADDRELDDVADQLRAGLHAALVQCQCSVDGESLRRELWRVWGGTGSIAVKRHVPFAVLRRHALAADARWRDIASSLPFAD